MNNTEPDWVEALMVILLSLAFALGVFAAFIPGTSYAETLQAGTLCWQAPTQRLNGDPIEPNEISHYEIQQGETLHIVTGTEFDFVIESYGEHCFYARAVDTDDRQSPQAGPVCVTVNAPPAAIRFRECEG